MVSNLNTQNEEAGGSGGFIAENWPWEPPPVLDPANPPSVSDIFGTPPPPPPQPPEEQQPPLLPPESGQPAGLPGEGSGPQGPVPLPPPGAGVSGNDSSSTTRGEPSPPNGRSGESPARPSPRPGRIGIIVPPFGGGVGGSSPSPPATSTTEGGSAPGRVGLPPPLPIQFPTSLIPNFSSLGGTIAGGIVSGLAGLLGGGSSTTVNIQNQINIPAGIFAGVEAAITSSISQEANAVTGFASQLAGSMQAAMGTLVNSFASGIKSALGSIVDALGSAIGNIVKSIGDVIGSIAGKIKDAIDVIKDRILPAIGNILGRIADAVKQLTDFYSQKIAPIINLISATLRTIDAVQKDIHQAVTGGIKGILALPVELSDALSGWAGALDRTRQQLSKKTDSVISDVVFGGMSSDPKHNVFGKIASSLSGAGLGKILEQFATGKQLEYETDTEIGRDIGKLLPDILKSEFTIGVEAFKEIFSHWDSAIEAVGGGIAAYFEFAPVLVILGAAALFALKPLHEYIEEKVNSVAPLLKLDPATLQEALNRNLVDGQEFRKELLLQGISPARADTYMQLARRFIDVGAIIDARWRGVFDDSTARGYLGRSGFANQDIDALFELSTKIFSPQTASEAYRRSLIDEKEFRSILSLNRFSDAETETAVALAFRPPSMAESFNGILKSETLGLFTTDVNTFETPPSWFIAAGKAEGANDDAILYRWIATWYTPDVQTILNLYYRGYRTLSEVHSVFDGLHIPKGLHDDLVQVFRPLIPFRTIPSMVASGIVSQADGKAILEAHGYSSLDAGRLIDYSVTGKHAAKAAAAQQAHSLSLAVSKQLFQAGAITDVQYHQALLAHGYDKQSADLELALEEVIAATAARKQAAEDIINQFLAGEIDLATAQQDFAQAGLTPSEQAKYGRQLRSTASAKNKIPSEPELYRFLKVGLISNDDYHSALLSLGYAATWADAFLAMRAGEQTTTPQGSQSPSQGG